MTPSFHRIAIRHHHYLKDGKKLKVISLDNYLINNMKPHDYATRYSMSL